MLNIFIRIRIPDVNEKLKMYTLGRTYSSNLVYTIWAIFGGFILHFLLSNYLTVLLKPSFEEPVETTEDLIKRDITPFLWPGAEIFVQRFEASPDPIFQEISRRIIVAKDWYEYYDLVLKVNSTGLFAEMGAFPSLSFVPDEYWYRSSETVSGSYPYYINLSNKKWPLTKVKLVCNN